MSNDELAIDRRFSCIVATSCEVDSSRNGILTDDTPNAAGGIRTVAGFESNWHAARR